MLRNIVSISHWDPSDDLDNIGAVLIVHSLVDSNTVRDQEGSDE